MRIKDQILAYLEGYIKTNIDNGQQVTDELYRERITVLKEFLSYLEEKNIINHKTLGNNEEVKRLVNGLIKIDLSKIVSAGRENLHVGKSSNDSHNTRNNTISEHITSKRILNSHAKPTGRQKKYTRLSKKGSTISDKENNPISQNANVQSSVNYHRVMNSSSSRHHHGNFDHKSENAHLKPSHWRNYSTGNAFKLNIENWVIDQKSAQNKDKQYTHR